jgi:hypothetical protein
MDHIAVGFNRPGKARIVPVYPAEGKGRKYGVIETTQDSGGERLFFSRFWATARR